MLNSFYEKIGGTGSVSAIIISVALILFSGFLMTRLTKLVKLPNVTAYILAGIIIGPYALDLIPREISLGMDFVSDIALAFIAFSVGEFFRLSTLKRNGGKVVIITLFEALIASVAVFALTYFILGLGLAFSVILSALASATAPASTMMTIRQTNAKGDFVDTLLSVVALDDVVSLIAFSVAVSIAMATLDGKFNLSDVAMPILKNLILIAVGAASAFALKFLMAKRSTDNRLIVAIALLFAVCGVGAALEVSPLLACMVLGTVYINTTDDERLFKQLNYFSPPILLTFFVLSGINFRLDVLLGSDNSINGIPILLIGVLYFVVRILGKYCGAYFGASAAKKPKNVRNNLGLALIPQAGVAIGLAALGARMLGGENGNVLQTIILSSSILYELIGPACAKAALYLSGSIGGDISPNLSVITENGINDTEVLKQRLMLIEKEIADREYARTEEESAYIAAIEESDDTSDYIRRKFINRR